ncbi:ABC transporter permease [Pseudotamlana carrageenivorans]|uniref:ABC transporter permease n=1 Tax=Pseudotamlana carrageenivorans TaxID=2069432 RepID=A0A2I7SDN4_9FLAO|nr:ABC transporter permease subunit [Tamlana carrageenivorans]AUS03996.1 ABC transporter permease [Tamlana carrageenivorans]
MRRLLNIELQKLLLNRTSKILIFVSFILPFFIILLSSLKINVFGLFTLELGELGVFNFPVIWHLTTFFASQFKFFFAIVVVSMIGNEYSNKTIKQNLIDGLSKKEFILSKFYAIVFISLISTALIFFLTLSIGLYYSSYTEASIVFRDVNFLVAYLVKLVAFFSLCLFFGMLIKRSAFALAFLFILYILEWIFYGILAWSFNNKTAESIQGFFPLRAMYNLINQPFQRITMAKFPDKTNLVYDYGVHTGEILIVLCWTAIFIFSSYSLLKNRDL